MIDVEEIYELTPTQEGMLFHCHLSPEEALYVVQVRCELRGQVDAAALQGAIRAVVGRHAALRTSFLWEGLTTPVQVVRRSNDVDLQVMPMGAGGRGVWDNAVANALAADRASGFDLRQGVPARWTLLTGTERSLFVFTHHHLILDGWSIATVMREIGLAYADRVGGPVWQQTAPVGPSAFVEWTRCRASEGDEAFWRARLTDPPSPSAIDVPPAALAGPDDAWAELAVRLDLDRTASIQRAARSAGASLAAFMSAAWAIVLSRYTGQDDVVFGTALSGRASGPVDVLDVVGLLISTVPVRMGVLPGDEFVDVLERMQAEIHAVQAHETTPLAEIRRWAGLDVDTELFQTLLVTEAYPVAELSTWGPLPVGPVEMTERSHYAFTLAVQPGAELALRVSFDRRRIDPATAGAVVDHFVGLLVAAAAAPRALLTDLGIDADTLGRTTVDKMSFERTDSTRVDELFRAQAAANPEAIAVECGRRTLTYRELDARSDQLAWQLQEAGVGPEVVVVVCMERSPELVVALLSVMKAGGAYLPLDPAHPDARLQLTTSDAGARVVLTDQTARWRRLSGASVIVIEPGQPDGITRQVLAVGGPDHLAYIIYTSGSTGRPKGVLIEHAALSRYVRWAAAEYDTPAPRGSILHGSVAFDLIVTALYVPLTTGRSITVLQPGDSLADLSWERIAEHAVVKLTPSHLELLVGTARGIRRRAGRTTFVVGGEDLPGATVQKLGAIDPGAVVVNEYGPTEATVGCVVARQEQPANAAPGPVPIGGPIPGVQARVVAPDGSPTPLGGRGELLLGGWGLARGYLDRPRETAARFTPDATGGRLYQTGDFVQILRSGDLVYLGRIDAQVKLRGHRIELGEVEHVLRGLPGVCAAAVIVQGSGTDARLVAYVVREAHDHEEDELLRSAGELLPAPLVPSAIVELDALPLSPNGKLDVQRLPLPEMEAATHDYLAPRTDVERAVVVAWEEVLGRAPIGVLDDFFQLGGDSLRAARAASRLRALVQRDITVRLLFDHRTPERLADAIDAATERAEIISPRLDDGPAPLSFGQEQLWLLDQLEPGRADYNVPRALRLRGRLDRGSVGAALTTVLGRHDVLRSRFVDDGDIRTQVPDAALAELTWTDLAGKASQHTERQLGQISSMDAAIPFDLAAGPPIRARLVRLAAEDHVLVVIFHHIITDAVSCVVFWDELLRCLAGVELSAAPTLQYADYACWQRQRAELGSFEEQLEHWHLEIGDLEPTELPTDRPRPDVRSGRGERLDVGLDSVTVELLRHYAAAEGSTVFMCFLAGFLTVLGRRAERTDVAVGTSVSGRDRLEVERLIGYVIGTVVVRVDLTGNPTFAHLVGRVRERLTAAFANKDVPFQQVVEHLRPPRRRNQTPFFNVLFDMEDPLVLPLPDGALDASPFEVPFTTAKFDLEVNVTVDGDNPHLTYRYDAELFDPETIAALAHEVSTVLDRVAREPHVALSEVLEPSPPRSEVELLVAEAWSVVLGAPPAHLNENVFDLGGELEDAAAVVRRLERALDLDVPAADFLRRPTLASLVVAVEGALANVDSAPDDVEHAANEPEYTISGRTR